MTATRKQWTALGILSLPTLLVSMDATVTYLALPSISSTFKPTSSQLLWVTDIFTFMEGGLLITMGTLGDRIGRKKLLLTGAILFAAASTMAAFANTITVLIIARALLGITGATLLPCTLAIIRDLFRNDRQRTVAIGIFTTCFSAGTMLGPMIGGLLIKYLWWGAVFLISVPLMIIFVIASPLIPESKDNEKKSYDITSAMLLLVSIFSIIYGVKQAAQYGNMELPSSLSISGGLILLFIFLKRQQKIAHPLFDLSLFKIPAFNATLLTLFFALFCWSGIYLFIAQFMQLVMDFDPLQAGMLTLPAAALSIAGCMIAPQTLRWFRRSAVISFGILVIIIGTLMLSLVSRNTTIYYLVAAGTFISLGCGFVVTIGHDVVLSSTPHGQAGLASGVSESSTTFGSAFGVAILGSIGAAVYRNNLAVSISGNFAPDILNQTTKTLGSTLAASNELSDAIGASLKLSARDAFIKSLNAGAVAATILLIIVAIIFIYALRRWKIK